MQREGVGGEDGCAVQKGGAFDSAVLGSGGNWASGGSWVALLGAAVAGGKSRGKWLGRCWTQTQVEGGGWVAVAVSVVVGGAAGVGRCTAAADDDAGEFVESAAGACDGEDADVGRAAAAAAALAADEGEQTAEATFEQLHRRKRHLVAAPWQRQLGWSCELAALVWVLEAAMRTCG